MTIPRKPSRNTRNRISIFLSFILLFFVSVQSTLPVKAEETSHIHNEGSSFVQSIEVDDVIITVSAEHGVFPDGAVLSAQKVNDLEADKAVEEKRESGKKVVSSYTFDIKIPDENGNELEPQEGQSVSVSFKMKEVTEKNLETDIYHIEEDKGVISAEELSFSENGDVLIAETESFSLFTVEFSYRDLSYVLNGEERIPLSEILNAVGLTGEVNDATVSNENCISVSRDDGVWYVYSLQPFSTEETLQVTIGDYTYEISVTDDNEETYWAQVQALINDAPDDSTLMLSQDLIGATGVSPLNVPEGKESCLTKNNGNQH